MGFSGTNRGMSARQLDSLGLALRGLRRDGYGELHHGLCIGADEQCARLAKELGFRVVAHPGFNKKKPDDTLFRSDWGGSDETREPKPFVERDRDIVDETERLVAAPLTREERIRSGTWTTVRYARGLGRPVDVLTP